MSNNTRCIDRHKRPRAGSLALALVVLALPGCAVQRGATVVSAQPSLTSPALAERERLLSSLRTPAIMEYSGPSGHLKAREQLSVQRPASLRIEAMSPLGVAMVVTADHDHIAVYNPSSNTLTRGSASAATLARFTQFVMTPEQLVSLLLGLAPDASILSEPAIAEWSEGGTRIESYNGRDKVNYELGFKDDQLALVRAKRLSGQAIYEVHYGDYRDIGAIKFPFEVKAEFFPTATTLTLRYLDPAIDQTIPDASFQLSPGPGTKLIELG